MTADIKKKQYFIDPKTNQRFEAEPVNDDKLGHIGWLVPLWVRSQPETWKLYTGKVVVN